MAVKGTYTRFLLDEFDFSGDSNSLSVAVTTPALDTTALQATGMTSKPGLPSGVMTVNGYYNGADASAVSTVFNARLGTATPMIAAGLFGTDVVNCPSYVFESTYLADHAPAMSAPGEIITFAGGIPSAGGQVYSGFRVFSGALSATGAQTGYDFGAAGSAGGRAWVFVQAITGSATDAMIDVESDDNAGFTSAASEGTATFSAVGVQTVALSGTVDQYIRINCTDLGGATDFTVVVIVAISGVTY